MNKEIKRKVVRHQGWYRHFEKHAPHYKKYRKSYGYYWNNISLYLNYFIQESDHVLQIGCGTGETLNDLNCVEKTGIDFSPAMINEAKKSFPDIKFYVMEAEDLEFDQRFDVIILSNVVGFFENVLAVFEEIKNYCHPRTRVFVVYYSRLWEPVLRLAEFLKLRKSTAQQNWLSQKDIENLLYLGGFETFRRNMRMLIPINIPIISWFTNKYISRLPFLNNLCLSQIVVARPFPKPNSSKLNSYSVSVVVPARNERGNIEAAILRTPMMGLWTELIFVEGNSTDGTWLKIKEMQEQYKYTHRIKIAQQDGNGKGDAVRKGFQLAEGDILMILDADLTVPPEDLPMFYKALAMRKGEFINGSRLVYPIEKQAMRFLNTLGNKFFSYLFSWLLEQPIKDTLCGTKVLFRSDYEKLKRNRKFFDNFDPFGDFDLLFGAYKLNLKIIDLPVRYHKRHYGDTNISRFRHGLILLKMSIYAANRIKFW